MVNMSDVSWLVLGFLIGSFLNVVIHRLPRMVGGQGEDIVIKESPPSRQLPLASPRSHCPPCGNLLRALENILVLSYCLLRGRCSAWNGRISLRYPVVKILGAVGALGAALMLRATPQGWAAIIFVWFSIAFIDLEHYLTPGLLVLPLLWLGLLLNAFGLFISPSAAILGAIVGYLAFWVINALAVRTLQRTAIGHEDFKLFATISAWLGWGRWPLFAVDCLSSGRLDWLRLVVVGALAVLLSGGRILI